MNVDAISHRHREYLAGAMLLATLIFCYGPAAAALSGLDRWLVSAISQADRIAADGAAAAASVTTAIALIGSGVLVASALAGRSLRMMSQLAAANLALLVAVCVLAIFLAASPPAVSQPLVILVAVYLLSAWLATRRSSPLRGSAVRASALIDSGRLDAAYRELKGCTVGPETAGLFFSLAEEFGAADRQDDARAVFRFVAATALGRTSSRQQKRSDPNLPVGIPRTIGRYDVEGLLGKGAMGHVFLARDMRINRVVALKVVSLEREFDAQGLDAARARFFQEAESAGRLHHPDIVMIYDAGEIEHFSFIAMQYVDGTPLSEYTGGHARLADEQIIELGARAAEALAYAHERHVVHRDIKPANLIYHVPTDSLKIMDFGVAQLSDAVRTRTGIILGTPAYMSPEQLFGEKLSGYSDLFSLGVTLYELFTGEVPFKGEGMQELVEALTMSQPKAIASLRPDLPANIQGFFDTALAKKPGERFANGWDMADTLRTFAPATMPEIKLISNSN